MELTKKELVSLPKIDAHNHLNLGMRYAAYSAWAGFKIPNFPRKFNGLTDMHTIITDYTRPRQKTAQDIEALLSMSIEEAIKDNVIILEGSVDISFVIQCGSVDNFLSLVQGVKKKYARKTDFRPELGMGKLFDIAKIKEWAPSCLKSGIFKSIDLYGPEVDEDIENFKGVFELAGKLGIKKKAHIGEFSNAASVRRFVEFFELNEVQHGIGAASDDSVMQFLRDKKIRCNVCPQSNCDLSAVPSLAEHPIKKLVDAGVRVSIGSDDILFFDRTVSEQCWDMLQAGILTGAQIASIFESNISERT